MALAEAAKRLIKLDSPNTPDAEVDALATRIQDMFSTVTRIEQDAVCLLLKNIGDGGEMAQIRAVLLILISRLSA